jgi:cytochrome c
MRDTGTVVAGLVVFLAVVTSPVWYHSVKGEESAPLELKTPSDSEECVAPVEYMRAFHMDLLNDWRDEAVRDGDRIHIGPSGKVYEKSLTGGCIGCHSERKEFCGRCHEYVGADPYCWDCHGDPGEAHSASPWTGIWER